MARYTDTGEYRDVYKEAFGFRPSFDLCANFLASTEEAQAKEMDYLYRAAELAMESEKRQEAAAVVAFEKKVSELVALGAGCKRTAIRWLVQSMDLGSGEADAGYVCYRFGLPYSMEATIKAAMK